MTSQGDLHHVSAPAAQSLLTLFLIIEHTRHAWVSSRHCCRPTCAKQYFIVSHTHSSIYLNGVVERLISQPSVRHHGYSKGLLGKILSFSNTLVLYLWTLALAQEAARGAQSEARHFLDSNVKRFLCR